MTARDDRACVVSVCNNKIRGFHEGVSIGASNAGASDRRMMLGCVDVRNNHIGLHLPMFARSRWGVMVGNVISASVVNNQISVITPDPKFRPPASDGVRVWGHSGPMIQVERNTAVGASIGARFKPTNLVHEDDIAMVWKISDISGSNFITTNGYRGPGKAEATHQVNTSF